MGVNLEAGGSRLPSRLATGDRAPHSAGRCLALRVCSPDSLPATSGNCPRDVQGEERHDSVRARLLIFYPRTVSRACLDIPRTCRNIDAVLRERHGKVGRGKCCTVSGATIGAHEVGLSTRLALAESAR